MMDETGSVTQMQKMQTRKQVSMETTTPLQEVKSSSSLESIHAMRGQVEHGLELMGEIRSRLEQAYNELS